MHITEARELFKSYLVVPCPEKGCEKPVGELCNTQGVWLHASRMLVKFYRKEAEKSSTRVKLNVFINLDDSLGPLYSAEWLRSVIGDHLRGRFPNNNPLVYIESYNIRKD